MNALGWVAAAIVAAPWAHVHTLELEAEDGQALRLTRYLPHAEDRAAPAVICVADFGVDRGAFAFSAAGWVGLLNELGRTVYVAEVRGQRPAKALAATPPLEGVVRYDMRAIARAVRGDGHPVFDLVAHGYAGALAMAGLAGDISLHQVIALSTPVEPDRSAGLFLRTLSEHVAFDGLWASERGRHAFNLLLLEGGRFAPGAVAAARAGLVRGIPARVADALVSWAETGDVIFENGQRLGARWARLHAPVLLFLPQADAVAPAEFSVPLQDRASARVVLRALSRADGLGEDYTHLSLLLGRGVASDLGPTVRRFLDPLEDAP